MKYDDRVDVAVLCLTMCNGQIVIRIKYEPGCGGFSLWRSSKVDPYGDITYEMDSAVLFDCYVDALEYANAWFHAARTGKLPSVYR